MSATQAMMRSHGAEGTMVYKNPMDGHSSTTMVSTNSSPVPLNDRPIAYAHSSPTVVVGQHGQPMGPTMLSTAGMSTATPMMLNNNNMKIGTTQSAAQQIVTSTSSRSLSTPMHSTNKVSSSTTVTPLPTTVRTTTHVSNYVPSGAFTTKAVSSHQQILSSAAGSATNRSVPLTAAAERVYQQPTGSRMEASNLSYQQQMYQSNSHMMYCPQGASIVTVPHNARMMPYDAHQVPTFEYPVSFSAPSPYPLHQPREVSRNMSSPRDPKEIIPSKKPTRHCC